jgi:hypothetical protein
VNKCWSILLATALLSVSLAQALCQTNPQVGPQQPVGQAPQESSNSIEIQKLKLEERKLAMQEQIEINKLQVQRQTNLINSFAIPIPIVLGVLTIWWGFTNLKKTSETQMLVKIAEITMSSPNASIVVQKNKLLGEIFGKTLPKEFPTHLTEIKPDEYLGFSPDIRTDVVEMLAKYPAQRKQIINDWLELFPGELWMERLKGRTETEQGTASVKSQDKYGGFSPDIRTNAVEMLAKYPGQRKQIIIDCLKLFPGEPSMERLKERTDRKEERERSEAAEKDRATASAKSQRDVSSC